VGGPTSASQKWATTNVVARFLPFILTSPAANACYAETATTTTSLASKREPEVVFFVLLTCHPPPPPPSHPIVSWRWCFSFFQHVTHHHHLPCVQTRAGGGFFVHSTACATTTTSLASKCEPEVVLFSCFEASAAVATSSPPTN